MATRNPMADEKWYKAKGKQVLDATNVPISREEVNPDAEGKKKGGMVRSSASRRADGIASKGKTRGRVL